MTEIVTDSINDRLMTEIYKFRYDVYIDELGYLVNNSDLACSANLESDEYDEYAIHIAIKDNGGIVAYARIIRDKGQGLLVLNKLGISNKFNNIRKVEVSRMIIRRDYRYSKVIWRLVDKIYKNLLNIDCDLILADTFYNSNSYQILKMLGFRQLGISYHDTMYNLDVESVLLCAEKEDIKSNWKRVVQGVK